MFDLDRGYWDDDPADPMPQLLIALPAIMMKLAYRSDGTLDLDAMECEAIARIDARFRRWIDQLEAWWGRRLARERIKVSPHPDTDLIAHKMRRLDD